MKKHLLSFLLLSTICFNAVPVFANSTPNLAVATSKSTSVPSIQDMPTVGYGYTTKGNAVKTLTRMLNDLGYSVTVSSTFTDNTRNAVKEFQSDHDLKDDGVCGKKTWNILVIAIGDL